MGQYMLDDRLTVTDIQKLFYLEGTGHFTPDGYAYFASAVFNCFYTQPIADKQSILAVNETNCISE